MSTPTTSDFVKRHMGTSAADQAQMLERLGCNTFEDLIAQVIPASIRREQAFTLPPPLDESEALQELKEIAKQNKVFKSYIGQGYYGTHTPSVILRNVLENPAWYTAYTPYQSEISQGRLEALINFQTLVCDLTQLPLANASMLDEATAAAEAMLLALRASSKSTHKMFVSKEVFPQTLEVLQTRSKPLGIEIVVDVANHAADDDYFAALLQYPAVDGVINNHEALIQQLHQKSIVVICATDLLALTLITPPGEIGADIALGSTQRLGMPMGCGGPHAAFLACKDEFKRHLPGRLVGVSKDVHGNPAYRLTLQTREQHIRREKATSNICTAQVLPAVVASMFAVYHGAHGLRAITLRISERVDLLAQAMSALQCPPLNETAFDTLQFHTAAATPKVIDALIQQQINVRIVDKATLSVSVDETTTIEDIQTLVECFAKGLLDEQKQTLHWQSIQVRAKARLNPTLLRSSDFLTHTVFNRHHNETSMLRYLRKLADQDLALDRCMIPLGSCTMKLNASTEMIPITWREFSQIHPYAPDAQKLGYQRIDQDLRKWLTACTGYADASLQPNAGSQGEYAGLLAINGYHQARGDTRRKVCLIPASAHGTNPASAQMVGMQVVVVACDAKGNVDVSDLERKCETHSKELAAMMITYPSTHGVFEAAIKEITACVHQHGGLVYIDGANTNALIGLVSLAEIGGDVSHLNLHKTFCIPHGGGGPGVGPVCVVEKLRPFLPKSPLDTQSQPVGAVSASAWGNAGVLPISWMYCRMMGHAGLSAATQQAILSANYISTALADIFPTLYTNEYKRVAHECILDTRAFKDTAGIMAEDIAKRLIDYGFHAPTLSFPVANTLMVEPSESEDVAEISRFISAMRSIYAEIKQIENGNGDQSDNLLKNAPHTAYHICQDHWVHPYTRQQAAYPLGHNPYKYWAPVGRVDNVYGDRNVFCTCIPLSEIEKSQ